MQDQSSETIARLFVDNVICRHGVPNQLLSDRGTNLLSDLILDICELTGMKRSIPHVTIPKQMDWLKTSIRHYVQ